MTHLTRMCILCRTKSHPSRLLRFVRNQAGEVIFDAQKKMPFRGEWVCSLSCLKQICQKRMFFRTKPTIRFEPSELIAKVQSFVNNKVLKEISQYKNLAMPVESANDVKQLLYGKEHFVLLSSDAETRIAEGFVSFQEAPEYNENIALICLPRKEIERSLGIKQSTGVVAFLQNSITSDLCAQLKKFGSCSGLIRRLGVS